MEKIQITAIIVTYSNRFHLLKQVIKSLLDEKKINKIIVIDNNSDFSSKKQLQLLEQKNSKTIKAIYLPENIGSAGGYKRGIEEAYKDKDCEFIWLLDDDNEPQKKSLNILIDFWNRIEQKDKKDKISLLSYRKDRWGYKEAIISKNPDLVLGRKNSFLGFHILDIPKKILKVLKRKLNINTLKENINIKSGPVSIAPYGGMFFHKNIINTIGYPNEAFFVYSDDHDWSYRITKNGGCIYLVLDSKVDDIDVSWNLSKKGTAFKIISNGSNFRIFYSTRNRVYFEKENLVMNASIYKINIFIFQMIFYFFTLKNKDNFRIFKQSIADGLSKKLGKSENINI